MPNFNKTNNQASKPIKSFQQTNNCVCQLVEPNIYCVNAAEWAIIQTFKNNFISWLCITDKDFPFQLWNHMAEQATIVCRILQQSHLNPHISAYKQLHGSTYDWNAHLLTPPSTRAVIYDHPATRTSWGPHGINAWYCGPALDHYRCVKFNIPETHALQISGTYELYPTHCMLLILTPMEHINKVFC
jgi:hypothetical protein